MLESLIEAARIEDDAVEALCAIAPECRPGCRCEYCLAIEGHVARAAAFRAWHAREVGPNERPLRRMVG